MPPLPLVAPGGPRPRRGRGLLALALTLLGTLVDPRGARPPAARADAPAAPAAAGRARVAFVADGPPLQVDFPGYRNKLTKRLDEHVSVFVNYDASYRAQGLELVRGRLAGIPLLTSYPAYRVAATYAPNVRPHVAAYGQNLRLSYTVDRTKAWTVFVLRAGVLVPVAQFLPPAAGAATPEAGGGEIPLRAAVDLMTDAVAGGRVEKATFVVAPMADEDAIAQAFRPRNYRVVAAAVDAPPLDTALEEQYAPESAALAYARPPRIVPLVNPDGTFTVGWDSGGVVHVATFDPAGRLVGDTRLPPELPRFGGLARDPSGNLYVLTVKNNADGDFTSNMRLTKYGPGLARVAACDLPASKRDGFDVMTPIDDSTSLLACYGGKVAIHLGKTMHKGRDGLNHQSGILMVVDAQSMALDRASSMGSVASHSFDQRMIVDDGAPVMADLADNLPRGLVLTKHKVGRVVFTYKTHLATKPAQRGDRTLEAGKWSNDNGCYTELGGLAAGRAGYLVVGASERNLDNATATTWFNEARNLFVLLVARDFDRQPAGSYHGQAAGEVVSDRVVISPGDPSRVTEFYDFYGGRHYQRNVGVSWLTRYQDRETENAVRPKLVQVGEDAFVVLWEKWERSRYVTTYYLVLDARGRVTRPAVELGVAHLPRGADPVAVGGRVVWFGGEKRRQRLVANFLEP